MLPWVNLPLETHYIDFLLLHYPRLYFYFCSTDVPGNFARIAGNEAFCSSFCLGIFAWFPHYNSMVYFGGQNSVVYVIIINSVTLFLSTNYYFRKIKYRYIKNSFSEVLRKGKKIVQLGSYMTFTTIVATLTLYIIRQYILTHDSMEGVGIFQASWSLAIIYIGIILNAMGARASSGVSKTHTKRNHRHPTGRDSR